MKSVGSHPLEQVETDQVQEVTLSGFVGAAQGLAAVRVSADSTPTIIIAFGDDAETAYVFRGEAKKGLACHRTTKRKGHKEKHEYLSPEGWKERPDLTQEPLDALRFSPVKD